MGLGWMSEAMRVLTGAPTQQLRSDQMDPEQLWAMLKDAD